MPLTKKQQEYLLNCSHRWNIKTGATGSGKSFVDYTVVIPKRILAARGEGLLVLLGNTKGTLERNIISPMREFWTPDLVGEISSDNTVKIFGKKVYALGADNKKHVSRIQGATFEYVYGDEITTWSEDVFQMLKSRLRCDHSRFDGTCNPDSPQHWFKRFLDSDADIYQQEYVIDDGKLPANTVAEMKKEYAGTVYYDRFILGKWVAADGIIYQSFADSIASGDNRFLWVPKQEIKFMKINIGVDFGGNGSAHSFVATGFLPAYSGIVGLASLRFDAKGTTPEDLYKALFLFMLTVFSKYGRIDNVFCDSAEQVLIRGIVAYLRKTELAWASAKIHNAAKIEINDRIRLTAILMGSGRFFFTPEADKIKSPLL